MPTSPLPNLIDAAYALEASTWLALEGHIPGDPTHNPAAWTAWRSALHAALQVSADGDAGVGVSYPQKT